MLSLNFVLFYLGCFWPIGILYYSSSWSQAYQIDTLATRLGVKRIAQGATFCLSLNYVHAILTGVLSKSAASFRSIPMIGGHLILAVMLLFRYKQLNSENMSSVKTYYKHIWDLFYLEYILYTLI